MINNNYTKSAAESGGRINWKKICQNGCESFVFFFGSSVTEGEKRFRLVVVQIIIVIGKFVLWWFGGVINSKWNALPLTWLLLWWKRDRIPNGDWKFGFVIDSIIIIGLGMRYFERTNAPITANVAAKKGWEKRDWRGQTNELSFDLFHVNSDWTACSDEH